MRRRNPQTIAKARELRDRYLEHVNSGREMLTSRGKYDVARALPAMSTVESPAMSTVESPVAEPTPRPLLPAA